MQVITSKITVILDVDDIVQAIGYYMCNEDSDIDDLPYGDVEDAVRKALPISLNALTIIIG